MLIFLISIALPDNALCQEKYPVHYIFQSKDTLISSQLAGLKNIFDTKEDAQNYIQNLPALLLSKGFAAASVDSVLIDSLSAYVILYLGQKYIWTHINTDSLDIGLLNSANWKRTRFNTDDASLLDWQIMQDQILNYYENSGYPFASILMEDVQINENEISGSVKVNKGPLYHIDSIKVHGTVKIKNSYLQHLLDIYNGSLYNSQKLNTISKHIRALPFLVEQQPWDVTMLGSGSVLNLYLIPKKSSQVNVLVGFLPGNNITGKTQITADVNLDLKNALGAGENILLNWQQLQPQSPKLILGYNHPYVFNSQFGINLSFKLLKRDSAYLQLNSIIGLQYLLSANQWFDIFYQNENNYLLSGGVDTNQIIYTKKLPADIDVSSGNVGIGYTFNNTDYRFNPRKGNEIKLTATGGIKKVATNNDIVNLTDPSDPSFDFRSLYDSVQLRTYRFKIEAAVAHFFSLGKNNVLKTGVVSGLLQSPQTFQNELFRIGGYNLLRGFDEESIYANRFAVFTAEYRYLLGTNSYFFGFSDAGFTHTKINTSRYSNTFISGGLGLEFETKVGLLNLSYAIGKRNDVKFDIRNSSKIHFGYINYF